MINRFLKVCASGLCLLLAGSAGAQQTAGATAASKSTPEVSRATRTLILKMIAAQRALKSYSADVDIQRVMPQGNQVTETLHIAYKLPNLAAIQGSLTAVSSQPTGKGKSTTKKVTVGINRKTDGRIRYEYFSNVKRYFSAPMLSTQPNGVDNIFRTLTSTGIGDIYASRLLIDFYTRYLTDDEYMRKQILAISHQPDERIGGVLCDVLLFQMNSSDGRGAARFYIGKNDHLLRGFQAAHIVASTGANVGESQIYRNVRANPKLPVSTFYDREADPYNPRHR